MQSKKFEFTILLVATLLVITGIWGLFYGGFSAPEQGGTQSTIGAVTQMESVGEIKRHFDRSFIWKGLGKKENVYERDTVYVGTGSSLTVTLVDHTVVNVGEDSLVVFERAKVLNGGPTSVYLVKGEMDVEGKNVSVGVARGKEVISNRQAKFTVVKRNKKISVSAPLSEPGAIAYVDAAKPVHPLALVPNTAVTVDVADVDEAVASPLPAEEHVAAPVVTLAPAPPPAVTTATLAPPAIPLEPPEDLADITPLLPKDETLVDLTHEFPALNFNFRVKHAKLKNLALQFAADPDFKKISFQSVITGKQVVAPANNPESRQEYKVRLSGVYLVVSEPVADLAYGDDHQLYWRVIARGSEPLLASHPQSMKFRVNSTVKMRAHVGLSSRYVRHPADVKVPESAIIWDVENRLPTRFRISFYEDRWYSKKICSEMISAGASLKQFSRPTARFDVADLAATEEYIPRAGTFCRVPREVRAPLKSAFYKIEALTSRGVDLPLDPRSIVSGHYVFKEK